MKNDLKSLLISKLTSCQSLHIVYKSVGCFHNTSHLFIFKPNKTVEIYIHTSVYSEKIKNIGKLVLSKSDIDGLDALFKYYCSGETKCGCTTIDTIVVEKKIGFVVIKKASFLDSSCNINNEANHLSFNSLLTRLEAI